MAVNQPTHWSFQPRRQRKKLFLQTKDTFKICAYHTNHIRISTLHVISGSHYMDMSWLSCQVVESMPHSKVTWLPSKEVAVWWVITSVILKPLNFLTMRWYISSYVCGNLGRYFSVRHQEHFKSCLWWQSHIFWREIRAFSSPFCGQTAGYFWMDVSTFSAEMWCFPDPIQVVFVPKPNQTIIKACQQQQH